MVPQRENTLGALASSSFDLLIIGGGIVGASIARDAAMRGLKTALVEQNDFAFGTSSRSSRLLHGGIRYLAQGRIGLVREASVEKTILHQIAPHLATPLPFIFPTYRTNKEWKLWQLKIGVKIYDLLCGGKNFGKSSALSAAATVNKIPGLQTAELLGAVRYFDGFTNDARLVLDTLRSAAKSGALLVNYSRFQNASRKKVWNCGIADALTGKKISVQARHVVNATGPWADGLPHSCVKLRLTKGIHLVVDHARLPVTEAVVMTEGKRVLFAIPWGERTILGTTDTDFTGDPACVMADNSDIAYVLKIANQFFPAAKLSAADVVSTWAGLRPLLANPNGKPSDISRSHEIKNPEPGWWDVAGGKLTTCRLMAEQTINKIVAVSGCDAPVAEGVGDASSPRRARPQQLYPCRTATEMLLPVSETQNVSGILPPEFCRRVVEHFCAKEWAIHLDDVMIRRTSWHYYHRDAAEKAEHVADWMGEILGWSNEQRAAELKRYRALIHLPHETDLLRSDASRSVPT